MAEIRSHGVNQIIQNSGLAGELALARHARGR